MTEDTGNRQLRAGSDMNRNIAYESGYWGGGDAPKHPMIGRWAGDRLLVHVDYATANDTPTHKHEEKQ